MSPLDFVVLLGSMLGIAIYGIWRTRGRRELNTYLKGDRKTAWFAIGLSVMATQASAITFLSTPGQGYLGGLGFVQIYFGMPIALIIIAAVFLPIYPTAERLYSLRISWKPFRYQDPAAWCGPVSSPTRTGRRFDAFMRPPLFSQPSLVGGWSLTIISSGLVAIVYTVMGGTDAVTVTQKYQIAVIFAGMVTAFCLLVERLPAGLTFMDAFALAGGFRQNQCGEFFNQCSRALYILVGITRRHILDAVIFRHGSIPGSALPFGRFIARRPAGSDVQRRMQNPDAVLHLAARRAGFCLLSI